MKQYDLLLIARPDHSYKIYQGLENSDIKFRYFSFKLFPSWLRYIIKHRKMRTVRKNVSICNLLSVVSVMKHNLKIRLFKNISEYEVFEKFLNRKLGGYEGKIIHYWPCFSYKVVKEYKKKHRSAITMAEIYFPCHQYVLDKIGPLLRERGYGHNLDYIYKEAKMYEETMMFEENFVVPSEYVAETYRRYYPDKNYIVVSYGIFKSTTYKRKAKIVEDHHFKFVYVGKISIEKGCDILMNYFEKHDEFKLVVLGNILESEADYFEKYKDCPNITFMGAVPNSDVSKIASTCDIGIHLSRFDAYSLAVGEIIGSGIPVVVSTETGICADIKKYHWGTVTELDEVSIDKAVSVMTNADNYNSFVDSIYRYFDENHPTYSQNIVSLYKSILENGRISK